MMESFLINIVFFVSNTIMPAIPSKVESEDSSIFVRRPTIPFERTLLQSTVISALFSRSLLSSCEQYLAGAIECCLSVSSGCPLTFQPEAFQDLFCARQAFHSDLDRSSLVMSCA